MMATVKVPVLIVGGGPVGLCTSLLCSYHGIPSLLVEQHPGPSRYPKARFINARTMEIFRQIGIEPAMREVAVPHARNVAWAPSLVGEEIVRRPIETMIPESVREWSPTSGCTSSQEIFEPVLLAQAQRRELAQIHFSTELLGFEQGEEQLVAQLLDRPSGNGWEVQAQYLIGADGAHSRVREVLGIAMHGRSVLAHYITIPFRADLSRWVGDRELNLCVITNPDAAGVLLYDGGERWRFTAFYSPDNGERPEDYTPARCLDLVRTAIGAPAVPVALDGIFAWSDAALVAERFGDHRAFLVGDAEHLMSPAGGFGMNVGIQDAHNLAWKLAAALKGWAGEALLASYEAERAPVSRTITDQTTRNMTAVRGTSRDGGDAAPPRSAARPPLGRPEFYREHGLVLGATYASAVIVPDGTAPVAVSNPVTDYVPNARPGSRAPHVWLDRAGERISTLDVFDSGFVLLAGPRGGAWCEAAEAVARELHIPLTAYAVGVRGGLTDPAGEWAQRYEVEPGGTVLVRPDGYVAWRSARGVAAPGSVLHEVLQIVSGKRKADE